MVILGIDPGTKCGWALAQDGRIVASGTWDLTAKRHEGGGMRFLRLRTYLLEVLVMQQPTAVAYEEVRRHLGTDAAHIYGGVVGQISALCEEHSVPYRGIPVGTVKKYATGRGNADKASMMEAAARLNLCPGDDNEADAIFIALCASTDLGGVA